MTDQTKPEVHISRHKFAVAYNMANVAATGRKATPAVITESYQAFRDLAKFLDAPNAVPVFTTAISAKDGKLDWDLDPNFDKKLKPTRGYFDPRLDGNVKLAP